MLHIKSCDLAHLTRKRLFQWQPCILHTPLARAQIDRIRPARTAPCVQLSPSHLTVRARPLSDGTRGLGDSIQIVSEIRDL